MSGHERVITFFRVCFLDQFLDLVEDQKSLGFRLLSGPDLREEEFNKLGFHALERCALLHPGELARLDIFICLKRALERLIDIRRREELHRGAFDFKLDLQKE